MPRRDSDRAAAWAVIACAAAAIALGACGGGDDDPQPPPVAGVTAATRTQPEAPPVTTPLTTPSEDEESERSESEGEEPEASEPEPAAPAGVRAATAGQQRAIREAVGGTCATGERFVATAVSGDDPRFALYDFDDRERATTVCVAIVRRAAPDGGAWEVVRSREGLAAFDQAVEPCPDELPEDLRGTVDPRGGSGEIVFCGN